MTSPAPDSETEFDLSRFDAETCRVLRSLCEPGAVLAVAEGMDKAVVVRDDLKSGDARTAVVAVALAQAMALKDWIACTNPGRISRYRITAGGRAALNRLLADRENRARAQNDHGMAEVQTRFADHHRTWGDRDIVGEDNGTRKQRYNMAESPLTGLARRRDRDGKPFLDETLVSAGERLREDFELAQMGPRVTQNWDRFLTGGGRGAFNPGANSSDKTGKARDRVARALADLGPGLSDVALRCCCFLEGLEAAEQRMGWSARSGKIVLRIALQRLKHHYCGLSGPDQMIG